MILRARRSLVILVLWLAIVEESAGWCSVAVPIQ